MNNLKLANRWYLVHTKPRKEIVAEQNLHRQGFKVYLPLFKHERRRRDRWNWVTEPLFPRYLFVNLQLGGDNISPIRYTTGVRGLVRFAEEPAVVPNEIIESLKRATNRNTEMHHTKDPLFKSGDAVIIDKGPFVGVQAIFLAETSEERVIVLLNMLGRENRITVERDYLHVA